ncbi:MAG: 2-aminoethylphosphonate--pyruvate transaminase [Aestuariivirgaceae bacterium]|nr:2-aminoethylphosphonate--pyruvate transaminase [Aestuariivirgaceae bacterium]
MPYLLTPGPLTTSRGVKLAMLADWGSWDQELRDVTADIRRRLLRIAGAAEHECVILQGAGSYGIEAALGSFTPASRNKTLLVTNGAYGERAVKMMTRLGRPFTLLDKGDSAKPSAAEVEKALAADASISTVFVVHCETTSGIVNPIEDIAAVVKAKDKIFILDAMSSFGALPIDMEKLGIHVLISSANKCIEGVPGFCYVIAERELLKASEGKCHSLALDLHDQWAYMEKTGQFRYTPPTHALVAFHQALREHEMAGSTPARLKRYEQSRHVLLKGMRDLGFATLLAESEMGPIIQTFLTPADPAFEFQRFYDALKERGFVIYPGKITKRSSFRIGTIGQVDDNVMRALIVAIREALREMGVKNTAPAAADGKE